MPKSRSLLQRQGTSRSRTSGAPAQEPWARVLGSRPSLTTVSGRKLLLGDVAALLSLAGKHHLPVAALGHISSTVTTGHELAKHPDRPSL